MSVGAAKSLGSVAPTQSYTAFVTPSVINVSSPPGGATSPIATVNVTGTGAPYTYSWVKVSGAPITIDNDSSDRVTFSAQISNGTLQQSVWRVTVQDNATNTVTADVSVNFEFLFDS